MIDCSVYLINNVLLVYHKFKMLKEHFKFIFKFEKWLHANIINFHIFIQETF